MYLAILLTDLVGLNELLHYHSSHTGIFENHEKFAMVTCISVLLAQKLVLLR